MKNILFLGGSSEVATKVKQNLKGYNIFNLSRRRAKIYKKNNFTLKNYSHVELQKTFKQIDVKFSSVFIFNGIYIPSTLTYFNESIFEKILKINLIIPLRASNYLIKSDLLKKNSSINFVCSVAGINPEIGNAYYAISKSALIFSSRVLSKELKKNKIRVNSLSLGMIKNSMSKKLIQNLPITKKSIVLMKSKKKFLSTEKIVKKFKFIIENSNLNGKNIILNNN